MTSFTAPPNRTGLVLNAFDILNVFSGGMATGTIINENSVENVNPGGKALFTVLNEGGVLNVGDTAIGTTINGGNENLFASGTVTDTTINAGGNELLNAGTTAIDTIINGGGVQSGSGTAIGTIINAGGLQSLSGTAKGTIINGGLESILSGGIADGVDFVGAHSTLALATPSGLTGFIRNWHVGDIIDFLNTKVTGVNATGNTLTVTYGDHQTASYSLAGQQANTQFALKSDGQSGTELFLQATDVAPPGQPFSPETVGTIVYTAEFGSAPSASELTVLSQFTQTQFDYGQKIGVMDPSVYAYQSLGVALATGPHFQNEFGPTNSLYPVSTVGDIHFVDAAYANVFGHAGTAAQIQVFVDQLNFFDSIYTSAGTFGSASNVDLLARGAVYGQMLGIEHENPPIGSPQGGTTFTAPPDQNNLVLNRGDILNVMSGGTATNTTIEAGAGEEVFSGGSAVSTTIYGSLDIDPGGMATNVVFGAGGSLSMASPNQLEGTIGFQGDGFIYATIFFPTTVIISSEINHDRLVLIYDSPKNALQSVIYPLTSGNNVSVSVEKIAPIGSMLHLTLFGPTHETSVIGVADGGHGLV